MKITAAELQNIKYLYFDLDGTLLNSARTVSHADLVVLQAIRQKGLKISIATGRRFKAALRTADLIQVNAPIVTFNGGYVYDASTKRVLNQQVFATHELLRLCDRLHQLRISYGFYTLDTIVYNCESPHMRKIKGDLDTYHDNYCFRLVYQPDYDPNYISQLMVFKLVINVPEDVSRFLACGGDFVDIMYTLPSKKGNLTIMPLGVNKAHGISKAVESYGDCLANVMAFGDHWNDKEMLEATGFGVLMSNIDALKAYANHHLGDNDAGLIGAFLSQNFLT